MKKLCFLVGLLCAIVGSISLMRHQSDSHVSVRTFRRIYSDHEVVLKALVRMLEEDKWQITRITKEWTRPKDLQAIGVSNERIAEYRLLLTEAGISDGIYAPAKDQLVWFVLSVRGLAVTGSMTGIAYVKKAGSITVVTSIEAASRHPNQDLEIYEQIEDQWYLFYTSTK